ncbi:MAG: response regulator [Elusimicrobiota bacterium]
MHKILVIEDDPISRKLMSRTLASAGFECLLSPTAENGLAAASKEKPDLVLMDVNLPDGDGIELCRKVKSQPSLRHIPILLLTGEAVSIECRTAGLEAGADDYMIKTIGTKELLSRIRRILDDGKKPTKPL